MKENGHPLRWIESFGRSIRKVLDSPGILDEAVRQNPWFSAHFVRRALESMNNWFLESSANSFVGKYSFPEKRESVTGMIMAGNIPAAGAHDLLMGLLSGDRLKIKLSSRDPILLPAIADNLDAELRERIEFVDRLEAISIQKLVASGSNNSARYFEHEFGKRPCLIRKNRWSAAVVNGNESADTLKKLASDILLYCGLGCRSASVLVLLCEEKDRAALTEKIAAELDHFPAEYLPAAWKESVQWQEALAEMEGGLLAGCKNITIKNTGKFAPGECGVLNLVYANREKANEFFSTRKDELQCIIGVNESILPGMAQEPGLADFADGVDTLSWLLSN